MTASAAATLAMERVCPGKIIRLSRALSSSSSPGFSKITCPTIGFSRMCTSTPTVSGEMLSEYTATSWKYSSA